MSDKWRIMIVDDEDDVRAILRATLSEKYEVVEAHDGLDALEKLERYEPDFICLDVMMPMMDGFEACTAIRKSPRFSHIPVMFLTALGQKENIMKGYGAGANLYLTKPFDPARLMKNIEVHFGEAKSKPKSKRFSMTQIEADEAKGRAPVAPGSVEYEEEEKQEKPAEAPRIQREKVSGQIRRGQFLPRVMVVDDDVDIISVISQTIGLQAEVVSAMDGIAAIEKLVQFQPDMMIIDIMIPRMSGLQLIQSLRANRAFKNLPILVCTARCTDRDKQYAMRVGANAFLGKPFKPTDLVQEFTKIVGAPNFRIRPKNLTIDQIREQEHPPDTDVFDERDGDARDKIDPATKKTKDVMEGYLKKQKVDEAKEQKETDDKAKSKRRIFGFGKK